MKESPHIILEQKRTGANLLAINPWLVMCFVVFQIFFLVINESERIRISDEFQGLKLKMSGEIEVLQGQMQHYGALVESIKKYDVRRFENHKHQFWTGKVK